MSKIDDQINKYKALKVLSGLMLFIGLSSLSMNFRGSFIVGMLIVFAMLIVTFVVNIYLTQKISSIKCPNCGKYVLTQVPWFSQNGLFEHAYSKCYFCGFKFE